MVLTRSFVRAKRPCTDGFRWFVREVNAIDAESSLRAEQGITAGGSIEAALHMEAWEASARVSAAHKPAGLMSGWWAGPAAC